MCILPIYLPMLQQILSSENCVVNVTCASKMLKEHFITRNQLSI